MNSLKGSYILVPIAGIITAFVNYLSSNDTKESNDLIKNSLFVSLIVAIVLYINIDMEIDAFTGNIDEILTGPPRF